MTTMTRPTAPVDPIGADLTRTLRALKLALHDPRCRRGLNPPVSSRLRAM